jgi:hypothetical protein
MVLLQAGVAVALDSRYYGSMTATASDAYRSINVSVSTKSVVRER